MPSWLWLRLRQHLQITRQLRQVCMATEATLAALRLHLEQVAYHHHNVAQYATPELEF